MVVTAADGGLRESEEIHVVLYTTLFQGTYDYNHPLFAAGRSQLAARQIRVLGMCESHIGTCQLEAKNYWKVVRIAERSVKTFSGQE